MPVYGWDASDFDWSRGPMDLGAAAGDGIAFFTHKATEGTSVRHARYGEAMGRAREAGIALLGPYVVVRTPGNNGHGNMSAQVDYFLSYVDRQTPWWRSFPGWFFQVDLEHWGYDDVAPQHGVEACRLLRERTGKRVVLYAPRWAYGNSIPDDGTPLWASAYGNNPALPYRQAYRGDSDTGWNPYSGRTPIILQYGSRTTIGTQPGCDANAFRGSLDQLRALITGSGGDMDQAEPLRGYRAPGRSVGDALADLSNLRDWLTGLPGQDGANPPAAGSRIDLLVQAAGAQTVAARPTQEQVDAAVLKAMQDPAVQKGIGDAIAAHLHVS